MANDEEPKKNFTFAVKLYNALAEEENKNVLFSPINVHANLSMLLQGAKDDTAEVLKNYLEVPDVKATGDCYKNILSQVESIKDVSLTIDNKLFIKQNDVEIVDAFKNIATENFCVGIEPVDFSKATEAAAIVNNSLDGEAIVSDNDFNIDTRLVLVSKVKFRSDWFYDFDTELKSTETFHVSDTEEVEVEMLRLKAFLEMKYEYDLKYHLVEIPFKNQDVKMVILLPYELDGITELEEVLATNDFGRILGGTRVMIVDLWLPKFKIEQTMDLTNTLSKVKLEGVVDKNQANFRGLAEADNLCLSKMFQKVSFEIDEKGCEPTPREETPRMSCIDLGPKTCKVNHPAIFMVVAKHETPSWGTDVLFYGKLSKPTC